MSAKKLSKKRALLLAAVAAAPLVACGSSPVDGPSASSSQALIAINPLDECQQGAQTNVTWVSGMGTLEEGDLWWATGAVWGDFAAYGAVNLGTQNVDEVAWVSSADLPTFAAENELCWPETGNPTNSPPTNPSGTAPNCIEPVEFFPPPTCMSRGAVDGIDLRHMQCSDASYVPPASTWCTLRWR